MKGISGAAGFTLVELLLSLALTALVMALTLPFVNLQKRLWERQEGRRESRRALAGALAWVTRDLEQAGYHNPGPPLQRLETDAIAYVLSRDEDDPGDFRPGNRRLITLWLDAGDLKYRIQTPLDPPAEGWESGSTQVLASGLGGLQCQGLDNAGNVTMSAADSALVACALRAAAGTPEQVLVRLRSAVDGGPP